MTASWVQLLLILSMAAATAVAEPLPPWGSSLSHRAWTKQDGAPSNPSAMVQDQAGMLWLGASNGLFRFDGVRFERVDEIAGHPLLSPNVFALALLDDALWLGYAHGGVSVFKHGAVRHYREADGLPSAAVLQFGKTADGTLWLSSPAGIYRLDGERWRQVLPTDGLPAGDQSTLNVLHDGSLLVTHVAGLYRSIPGTHRFRKVGDHGSMQRSQLTRDGKLLVFRFGYPVQLFDPATETTTPLRLPAAESMPYSVNADRRGAWWIGHGSGMRLYTPDLQLQQQFLAPQGFSAVRVFRPPFDDREGNLWFITENGVDRIRDNRLEVQDVPAGSTDFSITAGPDGEVWINSHSSLDPLSPPTFAIAAGGRRIASDMPSATAGTLASDGTLWFGNVHWIWNRRNGKTRLWELPPELKQQPVQAIAMGDDGRLWVSIMRRGVYTFKDGAWQAGGGHAGLAQRGASALHVDARGRTWFGYSDNAMAMLDHGKIRRFGPADGLQVGNVLTMFSRRGTLWIGGDQGVARFHDGRFVALGDSNGQPLAGVSGIVETAQGELWLHGRDGLLRIAAADVAAARRGAAARVATEHFGHLDGYAGAVAQVIPLDTLVEASDGRLWYATSSSVGVIDPRKVAPRNPVAPTPVITGLRTDRQHYRASHGIDLPQHTQNLAIDFTAAVLSVPERARFRTRLVGQDPAWRDAGTLRQAAYTNLGPGDYRFEVMAANEDGLWSAAPASLDFRIAPAFYQATWFKLACAALLAGSLYRLYLWRIAQMTARVIDRMRTRVDERERIARTLHDTFLQSVHSLTLRFHGIKAVLPHDDAIHRRIDEALDAADAVAEEGREQLMDLRVNHASRGDLATALEAAGSIAAAQHGVTFLLQEHGVRRALQGDVQDELFAIAREAIGNALRHAGGSTVSVQLHYGAASLVLEVRDDGRGLPEEVRRAGHRERHWGLAGMRERAARIGAKLAILGAPGAGTSVVLTLRASLAYR